MGFEDTVMSDEVIKGEQMAGKPWELWRLRKVAEAQAEISFKAGQEDCAKTHFKPDWEIKAQDIREAEEEGFKAGRKEVVGWVKEHLHESPSCSYHWCFGDRVWQAQLKEWGID